MAGSKFHPNDRVEIDKNERIAAGLDQWLGTVHMPLRKGFVWVAPDPPPYEGLLIKVHKSRLSNASETA